MTGLTGLTRATKTFAPVLHESRFLSGTGILLIFKVPRVDSEKHKFKIFNLT